MIDEKTEIPLRCLHPSLSCYPRRLVAMKEQYHP
jgi:hypothetical protein